jgi:hypothetical protein
MHPSRPLAAAFGRAPTAGGFLRSPFFCLGRLCLLASGGMPPELAAFKPQSPALIWDVAPFLAKPETFPVPCVLRRLWP